MEGICYVVMIDGNPDHVFIDEKQAERFCDQYSADYDEELSYFEAFLWTGKINQLEENEDGN